MMRVNADFTKRAVVSGSTAAWLPSPLAGVDRLLLDRIGDEVARATSLVRYAAGSRFSRHEHELGEEFLVLDGVFSDEHRDYPAGTYVRNPPGTAHSPFSDPGCRLLVKLRQFDRRDMVPVVIDIHDESAWTDDPETGGQRNDLHQFGTERVSILRLPAGARFYRRVGEGGVEWLLLQGELMIDEQKLSAESWLRLPTDDRVMLGCVTPCLLWQKSGHLPVTVDALVD